ncbi:hypothetical protein [Bradyrhizobium japonicum]|uniref:hypothetical protein n=1 Tax=Bradyrhizobium japonicum TaxID=375 RepID=UPI00201390E6|nr:hypothetical protein [Bradyrhizobium japonicum]
MRGFLAMRVVVLGLCTAMVLVVRVADAQMPLPAARPSDGAAKPETRAAIITYLKEQN